MARGSTSSRAARWSRAWWKLLGVAGVVGAVAAGAVVIERRRRPWRDYDAAELRERLHARLRVGA